jgi:hypothetical protein
MPGRIGKAIGVALVATALGSFTLVVGALLFTILMGGDAGLVLLVLLLRLPVVVMIMFAAILVEMLIILLPASLVLRRFSPEPAWAYTLIGAAAAAALLALTPVEADDRMTVMAVLAMYGAITGWLYWFAFRPRAGATAAAPS